MNRESTPITGPRHEPNSLLSEGDQGSMAPEEQDANPMYSRGQDEAAGGRLSQPGGSASLVFPLDVPPLNRESTPITGSRHEPNSLLSEGDQVGVNPVLQDANPMYSSGQDGAAGGRLNESEVFEAGLSSSLVFDSDGRPLNRELTPMIGPRLESNSLLSEGGQGGVPPVEQDANLIDSEGETKLLLDDRMNRKYLKLG